MDFALFLFRFWSSKILKGLMKKMSFVLKKCFFIYLNPHIWCTRITCFEVPTEKNTCNI